MTAREEFEAFWNREMNTEAMDLCRTEYPMTPPERQQYKCHETNRAWITWQASRAAALEEAAKECERWKEMYVRLQDSFSTDAAEQCAMGIRALKD